MFSFITYQLILFMTKLFDIIAKALAPLSLSKKCLQ